MRKAGSVLGWLHVSAGSQPVLSLIESSTPAEQPDDALEPRRRTTDLCVSFFLSLSLRSYFPHAHFITGEQQSVHVRRGGRDLTAYRTQQPASFPRATSRPPARPPARPSVRHLLFLLLLSSSPPARAASSLVSCMALTRRCTHS